MAKSSRKLWADYVAREGTSGPKKKTAQAVVETPTQFKGVVLGIDPSLRGSGFAVIDYRAANDITVLESSTLRLHRTYHAGVPGRNWQSGGGFYQPAQDPACRD